MGRECHASLPFSMVVTSIGITRTRDQLPISGCLQIRNLIFSTVGATSVEKMGHRVLFLLSGAIMLVSYITIASLSGGFAATGSTPLGIAVMPFLSIYFAGYVVFDNMFNTFVNPIALDVIGWKYYFVFVGVLSCYEISVCFLDPETRGYTLGQMAVVSDEHAANNWPVGVLSKRAVVRSKWSEHI